MIRTTIVLLTAALSLITSATAPGTYKVTSNLTCPAAETAITINSSKAGQGNAKTVADAKPAVEGSVNELDKAGEAPYQWTQRYIEQAMGVGVWSLISPNVTFGPYATIYNGQHCWMCKVIFHVQGDNRQHYAIIYEEPVMGAGHVVGCEIDF
jgi:hypothetical protein